MKTPDENARDDQTNRFLWRSVESRDEYTVKEWRGPDDILFRKSTRPQARQGSLYRLFETWGAHGALQQGFLQVWGGT